MSRKYFHRLVPTEEALRANRTLRWLGPLLHRPWLWQFNRGTVAAGIGIGVFFGFLIPVLQIAFAAGFAVLLRANLPVAAASTLVSNPFTYAPIGVAAYQVGSALLGDPATPVEVNAVAERVNEEVEAAKPIEPRWLERVADVGKPVMLGLAVFAVVGGVGAFIATHLVWSIVLAVRRRQFARVPGSKAGPSD